MDFIIEFYYNCVVIIPTALPHLPWPLAFLIGLNNLSNCALFCFLCLMYSIIVSSSPSPLL